MRACKMPSLRWRNQDHFQLQQRRKSDVVHSVGHRRNQSQQPRSRRQLHVAFKRAQCSKRRFRRIVNASPIGKGRRDGRLGHSRIFPSYRRLHFVACVERQTSRKVTQRRHRLSCFRMSGRCGKHNLYHNSLCDFGAWFGSVCGNSSDSIDVDIRQIRGVCCVCK